MFGAPWFYVHCSLVPPPLCCLGIYSLQCLPFVLDPSLMILPRFIPLPKIFSYLGLNVFATTQYVLDD